MPPAVATPKAEKSKKAARVAPDPAAPAPIDAKAVRSAAQTLKQVGDATRLTVLLVLADGEKNVGELAAILGCSQPGLSHHLALMRHSRLIEPRRSGRNNFYEVSDSGRRLVEAVRLLV